MATVPVLVTVAFSLVGIPHANAAQAHRAIGFGKHTVHGALDYALDVYATDVHILRAAFLGDEIAWWENDGDENFTPYTVTSDVPHR